VRRTDASKDVHTTGQRGHDLGVDIRQVHCIEDFQLLATAETEFLPNSVCRGTLIAGKHDGADTRLVEVLDGVLHTLSYWIDHANQA